MSTLALSHLERNICPFTTNAFYVPSNVISKYENKRRYRSTTAPQWQVVKFDKKRSRESIVRCLPMLKLTSSWKNWKALYETSVCIKTFDHSGLRTRSNNFSNLTFYIFVYNVLFSIRVEIINSRKKLSCELNHQRFFQRSVVPKQVF